MTTKNTQLVISAEREMLLLFTLTKHCYDDISANDSQAFEQIVWEYFEDNHSDVIERIKVGKGISDGLSELILTCVEEFKICRKEPILAE